jgi:hypothetical protein
MTSPHSPVEGHACLGTYRRNTATRSLRIQKTVTINILFLADKEWNMCRFYLPNKPIYCRTLGCNILLPSLMSIAAHENGQRTDYKEGRPYLNVRGHERSVVSLQARQSRFDFWQGLVTIYVSDEVQLGFNEYAVKVLPCHSQAQRY